MIKCRSVFNIACLKCYSIPSRLVRIGAFYMCQNCFENEFNVVEFEPGSKIGKNYSKWLLVYNMAPTLFGES